MKPLTLTAVAVLAGMGVSCPLHAQDSLYLHRVGSVGVGFFAPAGFGMTGQLHFQGDRFSAFAVVAHPVCHYPCGPVPSIAVGGGIRAFAGFPRAPWVSPDKRTGDRILAELYVGPVAQRNSPFLHYGGVAAALGFEVGPDHPGWSLAGSIGLAKSFAKRNCIDPLYPGEDYCKTEFVSLYVSWTGWRRRPPN